MTEEIDLYQLRRETAELSAGRLVANAFGIKGSEAMNSQQVHIALIDKREAWQNDGGQRADDKFEARRLKLLVRFGSQIPFHEAFDQAFRDQLLALPLHEVEPYLRQLTATHPELTDKLGYGYLADILRDSLTPKSANTGRALHLLDRLKTKAVRLAERVSSHAALAAIDHSEGPCLPPLTLAIADEIAEVTGLTLDGRYALGQKKKSALIGFHQALKIHGLVKGTIAELNKFFGQRYCVEVLTELYSNKTIGQSYLSLTGRQLKLRNLNRTNTDKL